VAIFLATFVTLAGAGAAFAYWTLSGSGSGSGSTGTTASVTVVQTSDASGLYPGDAVALSGDFNNPGASRVYVTAVTATVAPFNAQADATKPACTQADFTITGTSNTPGEIDSGNGVGAWSGLTLTMVDAATNQDNCKSLASIPITYASS
jgi:hypothetical protein